MSAVERVPAVPPPRPGLRDALAAFHHPNFTRFFVGALLSNSGTWVQGITVPFIVNRLTDSYFVLGLMSSLQFLPIALVGPFGGALADRYHRRSVLLVGQSLLAVDAFVLWLLWSTGHQTLGVLVPLVVVGGIITGATIPSWQAFVSELVPRDVLLNAVTLNSTQFNAARLVGPALGGLVLSTWGESAAFLVNALSYVAVLIALLSIHVPRLVTSAASGFGSTVRGFVESMRYSRAKPGILACFIVVAALGGLGSPMNQLFPAFAHDVFHVSDAGYGLLAAAAGAGAVLAAPLIAGPGSGVRRERLLALAMLAYGAAIVLFAIVPVYGVGLVSLAITGGGYLAIAATLNTSIQMQVDETMRGKVLALYVMLLTLALPVGAFLQGIVAQVIGPQGAVALFGFGFLGVYAWLRFRTDLLPHLDDTRADDA